MRGPSPRKLWSDLQEMNKITGTGTRLSALVNTLVTGEREDRNPTREYKMLHNERVTPRLYSGSALTHGWLHQC